MSSGVPFLLCMCLFFRKVEWREKTKVGLAKLLLQKPYLLLLNEPTNHLDLDAIEWLGAFISHYKGTIVLVSHDRYFLDKLFPVTYWLRNETSNGSPEIIQLHGKK